MIVAIVGSRNLEVKDLKRYLPETVSEIVTGGAKGIDACAKAYACENGLKLKEFLPDYKKYGRGAPLKRNIQIINYADEVIAFWDGESRGTNHVINHCQKESIKITVYQTVEKPLRAFPPKGLQSAARIICPLSADKFHTCSLRCIFCHVHATAENDLTLFAPAGANSARLF